MPAPLAAALRLVAVPAPLPPKAAVALPVALALVARLAPAMALCAGTMYTTCGLDVPPPGAALTTVIAAAVVLAVSVAGTWAVKLAGENKVGGT